MKRKREITKKNKLTELKLVLSIYNYMLPRPLTSPVCKVWALWHYIDIYVQPKICKNIYQASNPCRVHLCVFCVV